MFGWLRGAFARLGAAFRRIFGVPVLPPRVTPHQDDSDEDALGAEWEAFEADIRRMAVGGREYPAEEPHA
jgi:hypothetical protein